MGGWPPVVDGEGAGAEEVELLTDHSDQAEAEECRPSLSLSLPHREAPESLEPP